MACLSDAQERTRFCPVVHSRSTLHTGIIMFCSTRWWQARQERDSTSIMYTRVNVHTVPD
jgi:hypothetical protein